MCRANYLLANAYLHWLLRSRSESALAAGEFTSLHFRHAKEILGHPRLRVQTEEKVCVFPVHILNKQSHFLTNSEQHAGLRCRLRMARNTSLWPNHGSEHTSTLCDDCEKMYLRVCGGGHARCVLNAWFHRSIAASRPQHNVLFLIINMTLDSIWFDSIWLE